MTDVKRRQCALPSCDSTYIIMEGDGILCPRCDRDQNIKKWQNYEHDYILPCFDMAKKLGIDLKQEVSDNPGKNCVELLFLRLSERLSKQMDFGGEAIRLLERCRARMRETGDFKLLQDIDKQIGSND